MKLNIGCGNKILDGYVNIDLDPDADVQSDIRTLPIEDDAADEAIAIHCLEHLAPWDAKPALIEWRRVLKPGASLVLELPDLHKCCRAVLAGKGPRDGLWGLYGEPLKEQELMLHRWAYTPDSLSALLKEAGFVKVKVRDPQFHAQRVDRDMRIECRKP